MGLYFDQRVRFGLQVGEASLELDASELASLREYFPESPGGPPTELTRRLFSQGFLGPEHSFSEWEYWSRLRQTHCFRPELTIRALATAGDFAISGLDSSVSWFFDPRFLAAVSRLYASLSNALRMALYGAGVRGVVLPRADALRMLHSVARNWLNARSEAEEFFEWERDDAAPFFLRARAIEAAMRPTPELANLVLFVECDGREKFVPLTAAELPLAAAAIAPFLEAEAGARAGKVDDLPFREGLARRLLKAVESVGGFSLRRAPERGTRFPTAISGVLACTHLGHAGLLVEFAGTRVLVDPVFPAMRADFAKAPPRLAEFGELDAVFLTHHHADHCDDALLLALPREITLVIPEDANGAFSPRFHDFLLAHGFTDVRTLRHGATIQLSGRLAATALPFYGEASDRVPFGANTYLFHAGRERNVLVHADASPDRDGRSLLGSELFSGARKQVGRIPLVFGTWWQERQFTFSLSPLEILDPNVGAGAWLDSQEVCDVPKEFARDLAVAVGASVFALYAESSNECFIRERMMSEYIPALSLFWEPRSSYREILAASGVKLVSAQPFARFLVAPGGGVSLEDDEVAPDRRALLFAGE